MEEEETTTPTRDVASKIKIKDIVEGEYVKGSSRWEPNLIITPLNEKISRVRVLGTVVSRFISEDQKYGSITLDDGSDTIAARVFRSDVELIDDIKPGDIVDTIGKVKEYNEEKYINLESAKKVEDPNWELVRKLELLLKENRARGEKKIEVSEEEEVPVEVSEEKAKLEVEEEVVIEDSKIVVLNLIEELDSGEGVKYITLLNESGLTDEELENILNELMGDGDIYEPKIGRFKKV
jgi:RPA family protein